MTRSETHQSLRAVGLKVTPQREQLLHVLDKSDRPLSVEDIREQLIFGQSGIPTIYRNLELFVEKGWAEALVGSDQVMRFIRCHSTGHHHHIQCEKCGCMAEIDGCDFEPILGQMQTRSGFRITRHQLQLFGLCSGCQIEIDREC